ncbi:hypothetical protein [Rickettsia endosymbiont of Orchestes rusci]
MMMVIYVIPASLYTIPATFYVIPAGAGMTLLRGSTKLMSCRDLITASS